MFISVVYKDAPELSTQGLRRSSSSSAYDPDMSIEKNLLVNPRCPVRIMLEYIRKKCRLGIFTEFDLCDETGTLMGLFNMETYEYATNRFEHKKTYYLVVLKQEVDSKRVSVLPQLNHENWLYLELKAKIALFMSGSPPTKSSPPAGASFTTKGSKSPPLNVKPKGKGKASN